MKGKLHKNKEGEWYVYKLGIKHAPGAQKYFEHCYPVHPYDLTTVKKYYKIAGDSLFDSQFEFKIEQFWEMGIEKPIEVATLIKFAVENPIVSDDFQIGPNGAYEHTNELDSYYYHEVLDRLMILNDMMENYLIDHPVCQKHQDLRDLIESAQDILGEAYLKMGDIQQNKEDHGEGI